MRLHSPGPSPQIEKAGKNLLLFRRFPVLRRHDSDRLPPLRPWHQGEVAHALRSAEARQGFGRDWGPGRRESEAKEGDAGHDLRLRDYELAVLGYSGEGAGDFMSAAVRPFTISSRGARVR